jgi:L-fucose isomerase-like protein
MERFHVVTMAAALHDPVAVEHATAPYRDALGGLGGIPATVDAADDPLPVVLLVATGGTERSVLEAWQRRQSSSPGEPLVMVTTPSDNSLPAALEILARLHQDGARGRIVHLARPTDNRGLAELTRVVAAIDVRRRMHAVRIGLVGPPSDWLMASRPWPDVVRARWGCQIVPVDIHMVETLARGHAAGTSPSPATPFAAGAVRVREPGQHDIDEASRLVPVLRQVVAEQRLHAITVRCFDLVGELHTSGCLAMAALNDEGIVAGCEGDVVSAVGMVWVHELLGAVSWMANPAHVDPSRGLIRLAHCTIARSMVTSYELRSHFESGLGVAISGSLPSGPVTLLRIGGRGMEHLWMAEGAVVEPGVPDEHLCRTQADVHVAPADAAELLNRPLGNHVLLVHGHHATRLRAWWQEMVAEPV